jgi:hypothetical protein
VLDHQVESGCKRGSLTIGRDLLQTGSNALECGVTVETPRSVVISVTGCLVAVSYCGAATKERASDDGDDDDNYNYVFMTLKGIPRCRFDPS